METLREAVREVAGGGSATVVVHGRPGTGRSAVLAEASALARRAGLHVVAPQWPADPHRRRGIASHAIADAARDMPGAPLAVVVDDAQWVDPPSLEGEWVLARHSDDRPLLWVVAGCDPAVLAAGDTPRYELALRPLSTDAVRALLTEAYGEDAGGALVPAAVAATGGNPAVLCAALRRWPAPAPGTDDLVALAEQVGRHHMRVVLTHVPEHVVALVRASTVAYGGFSFDQVCELAGILPPYRERARAELARTGLLDSVVRPRPFHSLVADRVLGLMDEGPRGELYEHAVRLGRRDGVPEQVLGRLVAHTRLTDPWVPAALYTVGALARRSGDNADAVAFLERAVDRGASGALRAKVLLELAVAQLSVAPEAADRGFRRVLAEVTAPDRSTDRLPAADLLTLRGGDHTAAALASAAGRETTAPAERRTLLALRELALETGPVASMPGGAVEAGAPVTAGGTSAGGAEETDTPQTGTPRTADPGSPARACRGESGPAVPELDPAEAAAVAWRHCVAGHGIREARRLAAVALGRSGTGLFAPGLAATRVLAVTEDVDLARGGLERIEAEARRHGVRPAVGQALLNRAELALRTGDLGEARDRLAEAMTEVPRRHWHPRTLPRLTALEALLALESGRPDHAESTLARFVPDRHEYGLGRTQLLFARGVLGLCTGRMADARAHLRECGRILLAVGCTNPGVVPWRSHLAMAQASVDPDAAARLLADDLAAARAWSAPSTVGSVHLWTGLTLTGPRSLRHLRTAVRVLAPSAARARYVQAVAELAAALLDGGRSADGRRLLDDALAASRADGRPVPRAEEVAAHFAALPRTSRARLSAAQLRVALLAAEGRSNKAISEALSVSLRMVELHLTNSYRALGISGRTDLAAILGHAGPGDP
ncbi:DNA-binding CsgD family transcriptional regulator [Streptomyces umbrinus]|uniref:DNA-binding CsgD family transcriptional regulator n=1 Tax=Streptomyces umbrinus TaxID=67370 RepID=A0ABU0SNA6_9ACTN|nr:LuxR family transcriptional regulator [Streptomyces umbrinus]MDQ1025051.1 DNA-binding CsgD family transcriptional regulator [Streptomyces umbrinus]